MKHLKKLTALILALCMLVGMPLALDVSATGRPDSGDYTMPFQLTQAISIPAEWNTGLVAERSVALYFTGDVTIDTANTNAYITLVNSAGLAAYVDPVAGKRNQGTTISVWDATVSRCSALGSVNNYVVTLNDPQTRNYHELLDTIPEILDLAKKTGLTPVVRLAEKSDGVNGNQLPNNRVLSIYEGTTYLASTPNGEDGGGCSQNGQVIDVVGTDATDEEKAIGQQTNCYDYVDITITSVEESLAVRYVEYDPTRTSGDNFRIILSNGVSYNNRGSGHTPIHIRVVNSKGQVIYYNGSTYATENTVVTSSGIQSGYYALGNYNNAISNIHGLNLEKIIPQGQTVMTYPLHAIARAGFDDAATTDTMDWTATYNTCLAACDTLNARNDGETYQVAFVIDENDGSGAYAGDFIYATNGESANNWRIDALWKSGSYTPLVATHSNAALGINDRIIAPIINTADINDAPATIPNEFYLKNVAVVSTPGAADRVIFEFSKPITNLTYSYCGLRLYESSGYVGTHTYNGSNVHKQWTVNGFAKFDATGTRWIGTMKSAFGCDTLAEVKTWMVSNGYATNNNGNFTVLGNRRLEFSIADNAADTKNNRKIDRLTASDGSVLFANDSPFGTSEERAGIAWNKAQTYDSVQIESTRIYADKYLLIDFNQDVTINRSLFYNGLCIYDNETHNLAGCNAAETAFGAYSTKFDGVSTDGNVIFQRNLVAMNYYGNTKDKVLATLHDYTWLKTYLDKANAWSVANGGSANRFVFALRLQDLPDKLNPNVNYAIQGIAAADNIYAFLATTSGDWSTVYVYPNLADHKIADMTDAVLSSANQAVVSFSTPISAVDYRAFSLVSADGSKVYPATAATVNGTAVTLTFADPIYDESMGIRISGGSDYTLDSAVVTTVDGSVILANETASSAYLGANISDAVAAAKVNDTPYIFFDNAWAAKQPGDTLTLYKDVTVSSNMFSVPAGVTLDLNGHTLKSDNIIAFGHVVDSSNGNGLLAIDKYDRNAFIILQSENDLLPLYDTAKAGYRFFTYEVINRGTRTISTNNTVTSLKYGISLDFANPDAYRLLTDSANADVKLTLDLSVSLPHANRTTLVYTFPSWSLNNYASAVLNGTGNTLTLRVGGVNDVAAKVTNLPGAAIISAHSAIVSSTGVTQDSTKETYHVGITPAQAAFNWINTRITNNDLISFEHKHTNGEDMSNLNNRSHWTAPTITTTGTYDAAHDWTRKIVYTNKLRGTLTLTLDVSFNAKHASIEWVGNWHYSGTKYTSSHFSNPISNVRILNAAFPINGAVMTTARQGGQNYIYDFQPYSVDLTKTASYTMDNVGGRSTQGGWPYFDLTSAHDTYGVMGAIGWSGNWNSTFTYDAATGTVNVSAGMQNTNYQMDNNETLRTPSMVIQFFEGTQDDGHNAWRDLVLEKYTPIDIKTGKTARYAPITINTWGGVGVEKLLSTMNKVKESGQYFEYQWIDAGWYGKTTSPNTYDSAWSQNVGSWYYNPAYPDANGKVTDADNNVFVTSGGFDPLKAWHAENGTGLIVWFEPGRAVASSTMVKVATDNGSYTHPATGKVWKNSYFLKDTSFVNYGNANALDYIQSMLLHYLDDMGCYFYRQDYNFNPATGWVKEDQRDIDSRTIFKPSARTGVSEIKYVTGHYALLDAIINSGRQIDNCASGGRLLDIEMTKRSMPLWRTDYTVSGRDVSTVSSGVRSQGANLSWWLPISGGMGSSEGVGTEYGFRSFMGSGATMGRFNNKAFANKMIGEMVNNRELMLGDYYILQQGLHEGLVDDATNHWWMEADASKDYTDATDAAYEFYREDLGKGYLVTFRPNYSTKTSQVHKLKGLDAHAMYLVEDADSGETSLHSGRYLMEVGIKVVSPTVRTSHMIYFTKQ